MASGDRFTENEKLLLASLVETHKLVESKKTDAATVQQRQALWERIANEFNSHGAFIGKQRNAAQLKKLWSNLKQRTRKANTERKYQRLLTGGGSEPEDNPDPVLESINVAAPHADISLACSWDSTGVYESPQRKRQRSEASSSHESDSWVLPGTPVERPSRVERPATLIRDNTWPVVGAHAKRRHTEDGPSTPSPSTREINIPGMGEAVEREEDAFRSPTPLARARTYSPPGRRGALDAEAELRCRKVEASIQHQERVHAVRLQTENEMLRTAASARRTQEAKEATEAERVREAASARRTQEAKEATEAERVREAASARRTQEVKERLAEYQLRVFERDNSL